MLLFKSKYNFWDEKFVSLVLNNTQNFMQIVLYLQKTFNFSVVSFIPFFTNSFVALHTKFFPLSSRVGVNNNVEVVTLPSNEV